MSDIGLDELKNRADEIIKELHDMEKHRDELIHKLSIIQKACPHKKMILFKGDVDYKVGGQSYYKCDCCGRYL